jgi:hypothetical protein
MLPEDLFTDPTAALLNPVCDFGIDGSSGKERLHDRLFVGLDGRVRGLIGEGTETHHEDIFPAGSFLSIAARKCDNRDITNV